MGRRTVEGSVHAGAAARPGAQFNPHATHEVTDPARLRSAQTLLDTAELCRALATSQGQLDAALRRIDSFLEQEALLKQEIVVLEHAAAQTRQFAYHDELTGLPNRRLLLDRYNQAVALAARQHRQVALLFLDLDRFKCINDAFGHAVGDRLLQQVAARLIACIRTSDTACRFGGDEFVILLPEFEGQESAIAVEEKIRAHLATPYVIDGTAIGMTVSIGMAVYPVDGHEYGNLIQVSDLAMYRSKACGSAERSVS